VVEMIETVSRRELLAKAKELETPMSFATGVLGGLTLYLRGDRDEEVIKMLREGIKFCDEYCTRDLDAYKPEGYRFSPGKGPRHYSPSEVLPEQPDIAGLKRKVESVKGTLQGILTTKRVPEQKIRECRRLIEELLKPYEKQASLSLGEWKYGPTLRK